MQRRRRPRALTLTFPDTRQPSFILAGQKYTLRNFSEEGIGIWVTAPPPFGLTPGTQISGDVVIGNHIHPVQLEVAHGSGRLVGLKITHKSKELAALFRQLLEIPGQGEDLVEMPGSRIDDPANGFKKLWFQGRRHNELVAWYQEPQRMLVALQLCWLGKWVLREHNKPPESGHFPDPMPRLDGKMFRANQMLMAHAEADPSFLSQAAQILGALSPPLPGILFWQFLETGEQVFLPLDDILQTKVA